MNFKNLFIVLVIQLVVSEIGVQLGVNPWIGCPATIILGFYLYATHFPIEGKKSDEQVL